jgi:hypothetical protein
MQGKLGGVVQLSPLLQLISPPQTTSYHCNNKVLNHDCQLGKLHQWNPYNEQLIKTHSSISLTLTRIVDLLAPIHLKQKET